MEELIVKNFVDSTFLMSLIIFGTLFIVIMDWLFSFWAEHWTIKKFLLSWLIHYVILITVLLIAIPETRPLIIYLLDYTKAFLQLLKSHGLSESELTHILQSVLIP